MFVFVFAYIDACIGAAPRGACVRVRDFLYHLNELDLAPRGEELTRSAVLSGVMSPAIKIIG